MGIHGIYKEIGPGQRIALSKVAVEHFEKYRRPLRIAIDTSIWLFQIRSGKGGTNPELRTFYYRLLRLISLSIHPLFVFDGPNKPPFKRNKKTGPNVASIPEFLAKQLLKQFGLPFHLAPGEAEAECALLQQEGVVDAVLSEDVDTLMFGSSLTFRNWTPEANKSKVPTHINLYDARVTKQKSELDREGMILVALMSGGDYVPEGIPGCGPKTACEAARAGFGADLCKISRRDSAGLSAWRARLAQELLSNDSSFFKQKHKSLRIPDDFPNPQVLRYYTHPVVSSQDKVARLRTSLRWDQDIDFKELRSFTGDAFDWTRLGGAKKFIRNLAPALLVRELRMQGEAAAASAGRPLQTEDLIKSVHGQRQHATTDHVPELRVTFTPHELVPIDLSTEEPDDDIIPDNSEDEEIPNICAEAPGSPSKPRAPSHYNPAEDEKLWVFEVFVRAGAPRILQEWEDKSRTSRALLEAKNANRGANRGVKRATQGKKKLATGGMQKGALDQYAQAMKPGSMAHALNSSQDLPNLTQPRGLGCYTQSRKHGNLLKGSKSSQAMPSASQPVFRSTPWPLEESDPPALPIKTHRWLGNGRLEVTRSPEPTFVTRTEVIELLSSPPPTAEPTKHLPHLTSDISALLPPTVAKRRRSPFRRVRTDPAVLDLSNIDEPPHRLDYSAAHLLPSSPCSLPSPSQLVPASKRTKLPKSKSADLTNPQTPARRKEKADFRAQDVVSITSSPVRQANIFDYFTPRRRAALGQRSEDLEVERLDLTGSPSRRGKTAAAESRPLAQNARSALAPAQDERQSPLIEPADAPVVRFLETLDTESSSKATCQGPVPSAKLKGFYRLRDSLPGTFAVEHLDLSNDVSTTKVRTRGEVRSNAFRQSEISIVDLTGE